MASGIVPSIRPPASAFRPRAAGGGGDRRSDAAGGRKWWAPLFGWPAEAEYIDGAGAAAGPADEAAKRPPTRRFAALTEEKARELRMRTMETESFHDVMYHSAIASRLASVLPRRPGQ